MEPTCNYKPVCCNRPMVYDGGHHDYTRQAYRCPVCGHRRVEVSTDRGVHWMEETAQQIPAPSPS